MFDEAVGHLKKEGFRVRVVFLIWDSYRTYRVLPLLNGTDLSDLGSSSREGTISVYTALGIVHVWV